MFEGGNALFFGTSAVFVAGGFAYAAWSIRQSRRASKWPTTPGTLQHVEWREEGSGDSCSYRVRVKYVYAVGGVEYTGKRLAYGYQSHRLREPHRAIYESLHEKWINEITVAVHYNPAKPSESCLFNDHRHRWEPLVSACLALALLLAVLTLQYFFPGEWKFILESK